MNSSKSSALITGITGQDGSYLAELLLEKGYEVHGLARPNAAATINRPTHLAHIIDRISLYVGDLSDRSMLETNVAAIKPDEVFHLSGPHYPATEMEDPTALDLLATSTEWILATILAAASNCRFFLAGSSHMFGRPEIAPQTEKTPFRPVTAYGAAKLRAHRTVEHYRDRHGLYACTGILFNHESPRRSSRFLTRKVTMAAASIKLGRQSEVRLGNLDTRRDWGYAPDYVEAMRRMLGATEPQDFVIATGVTHSVRDFVALAFDHVGLDYRDHVVEETGLHRASEDVPLCGDANQIWQKISWKPRKKLPDIVREMVDADLQLLAMAQTPTPAHT